MFTPDEFREYVFDGDADEHIIEAYVLKHVMDQSQKDFLHKNDLTYSMIVNGCYNSHTIKGVDEWMESINVKLGWKLFSYY